MNGHLLFRHSLKVCISQPARPLREKGHSLAPMLCTQEQNCFDNCIFRFSAKQIKTIFILEYVFTKNKVDNLEGSRRKSVSIIVFSAKQKQFLSLNMFLLKTKLTI